MCGHSSTARLRTCAFYTDCCVHIDFPDKVIVFMPTVHNWGKPFEKGCPPNPLPKLFTHCAGEYSIQKSFERGPGKPSVSETGCAQRSSERSERQIFLQKSCPRPPEACMTQRPQSGQAPPGGVCMRSCGAGDFAARAQLRAPAFSLQYSL